MVNSRARYFSNDYNLDRRLEVYLPEPDFAARRNTFRPDSFLFKYPLHNDHMIREDTLYRYY